MARPYRSATRDAGAAAVHRRIIEAVVRTVARGVTELTVPAVAREAGVSVRTVYRHFGSKAGLVESLGTYFGARSELAKLPQPSSLEDLEAVTATLFRRVDHLDPGVQAVLDTDVGRDARRATLPARLASMRSGLTNAAPDLAESDLDHLVRLGLVLTSSFSRRAWREYFDFDADAAAAEVAWALRAAITGARSGGGRR